MLYNEQVVNQIFNPVSCGKKEVTMSLSGEINNYPSESLFSGCRFESKINKGALYMSNVTNIVFRECSFESGEEFCIDMSRCQGLLFRNCKFKLSGDRQLLLRCGTNSIKFIGCEFSQDLDRECFAFSLGPWSEEEKSWRPPVSDIVFKGCSFGTNLKSYIAFRALPSNIDGKVISPFWINLIWWAARKILPKKRGVDYSLYDHEQV